MGRCPARCAMPRKLSLVEDSPMVHRGGHHMKIKRSEGVVMLQCIVACLFTYFGHPYVGIGIALVRF